jgi:hypothetical protein
MNISKLLKSLFLEINRDNAIGNNVTAIYCLIRATEPKKLAGIIKRIINPPSLYRLGIFNKTK